MAESQETLGSQTGKPLVLDQEGNVLPGVAPVVPVSEQINAAAKKIADSMTPPVQDEYLRALGQAKREIRNEQAVSVGQKDREFLGKMSAPKTELVKPQGFVQKIKSFFS